jgi:uncharacterized membrane protein YwaF
MIFHIQEYFKYNHFIISGILTLLLFFLYFKIKDSNKMLSLIKGLLLFNFLSFYGSLLYLGQFNYQNHLPLHLCYLTEVCIFLSLLFKTEILYPWLVLNSLGGGITGFTNSNLPDNSLIIENIHLHLSHFNLLFFSMIAYKMRLIISRSNFVKSIVFNVAIFSLLVFFNIIFNTNYWFTMSKPPGINLAILFSDWPYYLFGLIIIGLISYYLTFKLFSRNSFQ